MSRKEYHQHGNRTPGLYGPRRVTVRKNSKISHLTQPNTKRGNDETQNWKSPKVSVNGKETKDLKLKYRKGLVLQTFTDNLFVHKTYVSKETRVFRQNKKIIETITYVHNRVLNVTVYGCPRSVHKTEESFRTCPVPVSVNSNLLRVSLFWTQGKPWNTLLLWTKSGLQSSTPPTPHHLYWYTVFHHSVSQTPRGGTTKGYQTWTPLSKSSRTCRGHPLYLSSTLYVQSS